MLGHMWSLWLWCGFLCQVSEDLNHLREHRFSGYVLIRGSTVQIQLLRFTLLARLINVSVHDLQALYSGRVRLDHAHYFVN